MKTKIFKIICIVLLMVFLSQQISWACGYNLSLLVNSPPSPLIYQDHGQFNLWVAKRVYSLAKPSFRHNPQDLKSAYQWLKTPATETVPCSAYVLYNLLQAKGINPKIEDISASLISLDLKAGNLKPPFTASRIDNSLYAMARTAKSQGLELYPSRLNSLNSQTPKLLNSQTPFIAHLSYGGQSGHFVLVTKVDAEKVYFFYDKGDTFLPVEKFLEEFSGYCLLSSISLPLISDAEAKTILGAGRSYHGRSVNISGVFKKPSSIESVIGIASSIGGAFFMPSGNLWATAAGAGIQVGGGLLFKDSMWGRIATGVAAGAVSGGLSGNTFQGALGLSWGFKEAGIGAAKGLGMSGTIEGIKAMNFGDASLRASIANLLAIPVGQAIEGGLSAKFGATIDGIDYKKETGGSFWKGAWVGATFQGSLTNKAEGWKRWAPAIAYYGGQSASIAVEAFGPKKYSSLYSTGISTAFNALTNVAAMGKDDKLWKVLGKSVADGALRGGLSIGLQKLTKDMRITEGAFLEMAGASLISAGVESAFGKWSGESAVSRKGIFWDNLQKSWKGAMQDVVTFGAAKGYMLGTSGAYAFLKMNELGSNVGKARASGLSAFDSVHWAFNQHVGSTYHNAAVNTLSNMVWNRVDNVKYVYGFGGQGTKFITEITQRELNKRTKNNNSIVIPTTIGSSKDQKTPQSEELLEYKEATIIKEESKGSSYEQKFSLAENKIDRKERLKELIMAAEDGIFVGKDDIVPPGYDLASRVNQIGREGVMQELLREQDMFMDMGKHKNSTVNKNSSKDASSQSVNYTESNSRVAGKNGAIVQVADEIKYIRPYQAVPRDAVIKGGSISKNATAGKYGAIISNEEDELMYIGAGNKIPQDVRLRKGSAEKVNPQAYQIKEGVNNKGKSVYKIDGDPVHKIFSSSNKAEKYRNMLLNPEKRDDYFAYIKIDKKNRLLPGVFFEPAAGDSLQKITDEQLLTNILLLLYDKGYRSNGRETNNVFEVARGGEHKGYVTINEKGRVGYYLTEGKVGILHSSKLTETALSGEKILSKDSDAVRKALLEEPSVLISAKQGKIMPFPKNTGGIIMLRRLLSGDLEEAFLNRVLNRDDGRPVAAVVTGIKDKAWYEIGGILEDSIPDSENNVVYENTEGVGALQDLPYISSLVQNGYRVMFYAVNNNGEMIDSLKNAATSRSVSVFIPETHGNRDFMLWAPRRDNTRWIDKHILDAEDVNELKGSGFHKYFASDAVVIVESCLTGAGKDKESNMANAFAQALPSARHIFAPVSSVSGRVNFDYDGNGSIQNVNYTVWDEKSKSWPKVSTYDAAEYMRKK